MSLLDDETIEVGDPSFIYEDTGLPPAGNIFWTTLANIWGTITDTLDAMYDPFAVDDDTVSVNIKDDYNAIVNDKLKFHDGKAGTCETTPQGKNAERNPTYSDLTMGSPGLLHGESQRESQRESQTDSQPDSQRELYSQITESQPAESQRLMDDADMRDDDEQVTPKLDEATLKDVISKSSVTVPSHPEKTTSNFVNDSSGKTVATHRTLDNRGLQQIIEQESAINKVEIQSVATSVLSGLFRAQKMNVAELIANGDARKVYMSIATILYKQNVAIDVREGASRGKSNEGQMREVWGSVITDYAKSNKAKCYLCGGKIVPYIPSSSAGAARQGGQPEMEHKLPCAVFYAKFAFIYSCFAAELIAWRTYVANLDDNSLLMQYYIDMNSNNADFNSAALNAKYATILKNFLDSFDNKEFDATNLNLFVNFVLPAYLSEFAYSHHLCNQLKSNHDLSDITKLQNYYDGIADILNISGKECDITASKNLQAACLNRDICREERNSIIAALFPNKKDVRNNRKDNVQKQNKYLQDFARDYAEESKKTEKRMILHTIKETIKTMKVPIPKNGKVTKKAVMQMNGQARIIAQELPPITNEVLYFLSAMETFDATANARLQQKAERKLRVQLDRTYQIFENAYGTINNITSQLKNAYVDPVIKSRIYKNAREYNNILSDILDRVNANIETLQSSLRKLELKLELEKDDDEMLSECRDVVDGLNTNLNDYAVKNPNVRAAAVGEAVPMEEAPAMEAQEAVGVAVPMEEQEAIGVAEPMGAAQPMEAENAVVVEQAPLPTPPVSKTSTKRALASGTSTAVTTMKIKDVAKARNEANAVPPSKRKKGGNKTRKVKKHHRKSIKKSRARKFTMKYKYISKKNTRRR
jgi:hypothetical protein